MTSFFSCAAHAAPHREVDGTENWCYKHRSIATSSWRAVTTLCVISIIVQKLSPFPPLTDSQWDMVCHWLQLIQFLKLKILGEYSLVAHKVAKKMCTFTKLSTPTADIPLHDVCAKSCHTWVFTHSYLTVRLVQSHSGLTILSFIHLWLRSLLASCKDKNYINK